MITPPYSGVKLVEYHDRIALKPIAWKREFLGLCKISSKDKNFQPWEGMNPMAIELLKRDDIWMILQWERFQDGSEEIVNIQYIADATEEEIRASFESSVRFLKMSSEELEKLSKCFEVPEEDKNYIADRFPKERPDPNSKKKQEEFELYQARLKVLAGMQPKTVAFIEEAYATDDPAQRANSEFEAVSAFYAELARYWTPEEVKAWQRTNPIAIEWIKEFARVTQKPRKELDPVDHEIVLNWLNRGYNLLTAEELSEMIFQATGKKMTPEAIKKRRERLGLVTKRSPGPRSNI